MDLPPAFPSDLPDIAHLHEVNWRRVYAGFLPDVALGAALNANMRDLWADGLLAIRRIYRSLEGTKTPESCDDILGHDVLTVAVGWRDCAKLVTHRSGRAR